MRQQGGGGQVTGQIERNRVTYAKDGIYRPGYAWTAYCIESECCDPETRVGWFTTAHIIGQEPNPKRAAQADADEHNRIHHSKESN